MTSTGSALERAGELLSQANDRRAAGWGALALAFYEPTSDLVDALRSGQFVEQLELATGWLDQDRERFAPPLDRLRKLSVGYVDTEPEALLHELKVEYARLFIGPERASVPPYESVYRDRDPASGRPIIMGPTTTSIGSLYRSFGLGPPDGHRDLPDHIGTELEFVYFLCRKEAEAWRSGDLDGAKNFRRAEGAFLKEHLSCWWSLFFERLASAAPHDLYRLLGEFVTEYLAVEAGAAYADGLTEVYPTGRGTAGTTHEGSEAGDTTGQ